jgi:hypothetical protein
MRNMPKPKEEFSRTTQKGRRGKGSLGEKAGATGGSGSAPPVTSVGPTGRVSGSMPTV